MRLIHQYFACDPASLTEAQLREYFLHVKLEKHWQPKSIRQARAAAGLFFVDLLEHADWTLFFQIRAKDHDSLPAVLTRPQVHDLLAHVRLRRYRTPLELICARGLRLSECLGLTIHDVRGSENKLRIRQSNSDRGREQVGTRIASSRCPPRSSRNCAVTGLFTAIPSCSFPTWAAGIATPARLPPACAPPPVPCRLPRFQVTKLLPAPDFLLTFTVPVQLRSEFFGPRARAAFDLLFRGAAAALSEKLAGDKGL